MDDRISAVSHMVIPASFPMVHLLFFPKTNLVKLKNVKCVFLKCIKIFKKTF